jgi:predicted dinucleotide-utilizing enzyme
MRSTLHVLIVGHGASGGFVTLICANKAKSIETRLCPDHISKTNGQEASVDKWCLHEGLHRARHNLECACGIS